MQPYIKAMTWAIWRERRFSFIMFIILASTFSVFIRQFVPIFEKYEATQVINIFAVFIELFSMTMLMISDLTSQTMPIVTTDQLYVKPVSSKTLTAIYLGLSIFSIILIHIASVLLYRFVGNLNWPFIIPVVFLTTIILCIYAIMWSLSDTPFLCLIGIFLICAITSISSINFMFRKQVALQYFLVHYMPYFLIIDITALIVSFKAMKNARCGEKIRSAKFWEIIYLKLKDLLPGKNWNLNTPEKAYSWLLFRSGAIIIPELNLVFILISFLIFIFIPAAEKSEEVFGCIKVFGFINLFLLPLLGALMTHQEDRTFGVSYQIATRPISEQSIITTMLKVFATCYSIGWIIYLIGFGIILLLLKVTGHLELTENILTDIQHIKSFLSFPMLLLYPLGTWVASGLLGSVLITGRKSIVITFFVFLIIISSSIMFANTFGSDAFNQILKSLFIWSLAVGSFIGTIIAMKYAIRKYLISFKFVLYLIGTYITFCIIGLFLNFNFAEIQVNTIILCGILTLPFAPFATAPVALYWNRHR